jgi:L-aspartate oxidase
LSECFVYGRRAAIAALAERRSRAAPAPPPEAATPAAAAPHAPEARTREALWTNAGLVREAAGLERLAKDPHPLARLIARSALAREETRGCHVRSDRPALDPALDGRHLVVSGDGQPSFESWS